MDIKFMTTCIILFLVSVHAANQVTSQSCDRQRAESCVRQMEDVITGVLETTAGVTRTDRLQQLCLDIIKGNNLTQCFIDATSACAGGATISPNDVIQKWEKIMQDLYNLCDGACPNFLERTVNITQCTGIIRFDALYDSTYQVFCSSLNASLQCVSQTSEQCPQFSNLFYDLLPDGMNQTASTVCTGGCENFDVALSKLETCKKFVTDLPDDLHKACQSYEHFKICIKMTEVRMACPMFGSLMEVLYPQHIFGLYELNCNKTQQVNETTDKCGEIGLARIDHCVRIFFLAWPANPDAKVPTRQQCKDYMTGTRCLEKAGFGECASLRQHFRSKSEGKQKQSQMMQEKCPLIAESSIHGSAHKCETAAMYLLVLVVTFYMILNS